MQGRDGRDDRSLGDLFSELAQETSTLVRQEVDLAKTEMGEKASRIVDLAKTEMGEKASRVGKDVGFLAAGGAVAYAGLLAILAGVIVVLDTFLPLWLAAVLVGLVVAAVGYFLVKKGLDALKREDVAPTQTIKALKEDVAPTQTIKTLKEDGQWIKDQTR